MIDRCLISVLVLAFVFAPNASALSNEPVTSLRLIDKQLSAINANMDRLKTSATRAERIRDIHRIRAAVRQIDRRAKILTSSYRKRHQRFGVKMFKELQRRSLVLSRTLTSFESASSKAARDRLFDQLTKATLPVVLQYQAISANIAANHCEARQWACCEPKSDPETNRGPAQSCRWSCVSKPRACVGFTGPQTPKSMASAP